MRYILLLFCCLCFVNCQERRRRIKKKIIVQNEDTSPEIQNSQQKDLVTEANQKPKEPRGVTPDQAISSERRQDVSDYDLETLMLREQQLQELLARESELTPAQREELLRQLAAWPGVPDSLPDNSLVCNEEDSEECLGRMLLIENDMPVVNADRRHDFKLHTTNSIHNLVDPTRNDVQVSTSDYHRFKKHSPTYASDVTGFFPNLLSSSISNAVESSEEIDDSDIDERATSYQYHQTGSANKFLGVTATTSQDIQLGLTFTVPFLSIPLASINSLIGGNFADIGNFLDFGNIDIGSIATIAVIGIAAIFVLPQAIYWLTGVNLSSFNWGRSEDDLPGIVGLANTVDHALTEFNIDGKGCMAKSMCDILYGKESEKHGMFVKAIANSAKDNENMKAYLGETKMKMLQEFGAIKEKYGSQPASCHNVFHSTCPWDSAGMSSIFMKLMASQGTNLAEMALKAASAASS